MKTTAEKIDRIVLWLFLGGGLILILFYSLTMFLEEPTVETITTHPTLANSDNNSTQEIKYQPRKSK